MSKLRFNHVFAGLLMVSFLCAFVISPRFTNPARGLLQGVFVPVSRPSRALASWALGRHHQPPGDPRTDRVIEDENRTLKAQVIRLTAELQRLQAVAGDYARLGNIGKYCTRVNVSGTAQGSRDGLLIQGAFASDLVGDAVLYEGGLAGKVERAGLGGAQVTLITDKSMKIRGQFARFLPDGRHVPLKTTEPLVEGAGGGQMVILNIEWKEAKEHLQVGDWVVLNDNEWHELLYSRRLGQIKNIRPRPEMPLFADIDVDPHWNLLALNSVMVMNKADGTGYATQDGSGSVDAELERGALVP